MEHPLERPEDVLAPEARSALRSGPVPGPSRLMTPVPMGREDPGPGWMFEPLFDGVRCLAVLDGSELRLLENGSEPIEAPHPELERALRAAGPERFALDGEIVDVDPTFEQGLVLPERDRQTSDETPGDREPRFMAFDLLYVVDRDLTALPLSERRRVLRSMFHFSTRLMYVRESSAPADLIFGQAERERWKGVVAKRADSPYDPDAADDWRVWRRPGS